MPKLRQPRLTGSGSTLAVRASSSCLRRAIWVTASLMSRSGRAGRVASPRLLSTDAGFDASRQFGHAFVKIVPTRSSTGGSVASGRSVRCGDRCAVRYLPILLRCFRGDRRRLSALRARRAFALWLRSIMVATESKAFMARSSLLAARLSNLLIAASSNSSARRESSDVGCRGAARGRTISALIFSCRGAGV